MKTATLALILLGVAGAGGGIYLVTRKRRDLGGARDLGAAQATMGAKAVQMGVPDFVRDQMGGKGVVAAAAAVQAKGGQASPSYVKQALGVGGDLVNLAYPGVGTKAANILSAVDSKVGKLTDKVPGLKKAKSAVTSGLKKLNPFSW